MDIDFVYLIKATVDDEPDLAPLWKIGISQNPIRRLAELQLDGISYALHRIIPCTDRDRRTIEKEVHSKFSSAWVNPALVPRLSASGFTEWFYFEDKLELLQFLSWWKYDALLIARRSLSDVIISSLDQVMRFEAGPGDQSRRSASTGEGRRRRPRN